MIMWMLSAGLRPYYDRPHDKQLDISIHFDAAELIKFANSRSYFNVLLSHEKAFYYSRQLDSINIESSIHGKM